MILSHTIRRLAELDTAGLPVSSFYLDTNRRSHTLLDSVDTAHQLVRQARGSLTSAFISDAAKRSVEQDLDKFTQFVGAESLDTDVRGLAVFSCTGAKVWEVLRLPIPVISGVKVGRQAMIRPLVRIADDLAPYVVVLADRGRARLFVVELGAITELESIEGDVEGRIRPASHYGLSDKRIERHADEQIHHHLTSVAEEVLKTAAAREITRIVLGGTPDVVPELQRNLSRGSADVEVETVQGLMIIASRDDVLRRSMEAIAQMERREEVALVQRIVDASGAGGYGVIGLATTLQAIYARSVHLLVVDADLSVGGWRCLACRRLYTTTGACPECGGDAEWLDDLVEEMMRLSICQDAAIEVVSDQRGKCQLQGMGALVHYPVERSEKKKGAAPAGTVTK